MTIRISNIVDSVDKEDMLGMLKKYGEIENFRLIPDRYTAKNLVIVFVDILDKKRGAIALKDFNELVIDEEQLKAKIIEN